MGSITGSILAATILTILPELLRDLAQYRMLIYAILLIVLMLYARPVSWAAMSCRRRSSASGRDA
jgi:branched-chain amino acid transport system permease protein